MDQPVKIAQKSNKRDEFFKKYAVAVRAGFQRGFAGLPVELESEECRGNRFGYLKGWKDGIRRRALDQGPGRRQIIWD